MWGFMLRLQLEYWSNCINYALVAIVVLAVLDELVSISNSCHSANSARECDDGTDSNNGAIAYFGGAAIELCSQSVREADR